MLHYTLMVTKNIVKQPKSVVEVNISVPWQDIQPVWTETLARLTQDVEVSGFRKGQAPLPVAEQTLGSKLTDEVFRVLMPKALIEALQGSNIIPIDYPKYKIISFQKGAQLQFSATLTERPAISVENYKGIKVTRPQSKPVTDEDVNKIIDELFRRWKARQGVGAPQQKASNPQPAGEATASGSLNFNGQPQTVSGQAISDVPDDEFAKGVGAVSLMDLRSKIRQDLENEAKYNNELDFEEAILGEIEKITKAEVPDILVSDELNRMLVSLQRTVTERGMLLDEYLKTQNKTIDQVKAEWKPQAERNVKMELGLSEVAKLEGINISDEELQVEIDKIQDGRVKAQFGQEEPKMHLRHALRQTKTLNLLKTLIGS